MICERCHKKEATIHITEVLNGNRTEKHLCQDCAAQEKGMHFQQDFFSDPFTNFFGRDSLFPVHPVEQLIRISDSRASWGAHPATKHSVKNSVLCFSRQAVRITTPEKVQRFPFLRMGMRIRQAA